MFLYTSGSTGVPKGVVLSHREPHLGGRDTARRARTSRSQRFLIAAPLYHMNALALIKLVIAAHATAVLLPQFTALRPISRRSANYRCTWLTAVPPMIAMMLREQDLLARTDLSSVRIRAHGLGAGEREADGGDLHRMLPQAKVTNAYGTTEAARWCSGRIRKACRSRRCSVGYPHPEVQVRLVDGEDRETDDGELEMKCPAVMLGYHNRPDVKSADHGGRLLSSPAMCSAATRTAFIISSAAPTTCSSAAAKTSFRPTSSACWRGIRTSRRRRSCRSMTRSKARSRSPSSFRRRATRPTANAIKQFALANAPAYQHPRFVWSVDASAVGVDQQDRPRRAAEDGGREAEAGRVIKLRHCERSEAIQSVWIARRFAPRNDDCRPVYVRTSRRQRKR